MINEQKDDRHSVQPLLQQTPVSGSCLLSQPAPIDKAKELVFETFRKAIGVSKYHLKHGTTYLPTAKKCALKMVDEIIHDYNFRLSVEAIDIHGAAHQPFMYWLEVKKEIEKL